MAVLTARERALTIVVLTAALAYQIYAVVLAIWQAPAFVQLFAGLGGSLPWITRSFLASYHYWWIGTLFLAFLSFDVLRRPDPPLRYFTLVLLATVATALVMHAWIREAIFYPMFEMLRQIG